MNNIVLCGFMGCGKSSVGKIVAKLLGREFVDTDSFIESEQGITVSQIFEKYGEDKFRDIEHWACEQLAEKGNMVIATGGGALTFDRNVNAFADDTVIFIDVTFEEIKRRIGNSSTRPLFRDEDKARALYIKRLPLYRKAADYTVNGDAGKSEVANKIIESTR